MLMKPSSNGRQRYRTKGPLTSDHHDVVSTPAGVRRGPSAVHDRRRFGVGRQFVGRQFGGRQFVGQIVFFSEIRHAAAVSTRKAHPAQRCRRTRLLPPHDCSRGRQPCAMGSPPKGSLGAPHKQVHNDEIGRLRLRAIN